jgi:hypothetical protein
MNDVEDLVNECGQDIAFAVVVNNDGIQKDARALEKP